MAISFLDWEASVEIVRKTKDAFFAQHCQSPIPPQDRPRFKGLQYYLPNSNYRFELEPDRNRTEEGKWILDSNQAYNPWCACSEAYICPFVPVENWLEVPIQAGEKDYPL